MITIEELTKQFQQEALDTLWLGKPVVMRWRNGSIHTGTVMILHARSRQAYIQGDDGKDWHLPIKDLHLLPAAPRRRWYHTLLDPLFDRQGVK